MDVGKGFTVYPAIDVRSGRVVRLAQGDYARETRYGNDPLALAKSYADAGAEWLHLVDLDAARTGGYTLATLVERIKVQTPLRVQSGGGVRRDADVVRLFDCGIDRVVVGSLSVDQRKRVAGWLAEHGAERITIALDARRKDDGRWFPATHGWTRAGNDSLGDLVRYYGRFGLRHLLCTDIERDGTMTGPNVELYRLLRQWSPEVDIQASGGARNLTDVQEAREAGCAGIVLGKALLEGRLDLAQALAC